MNLFDNLRAKFFEIDGLRIGRCLAQNLSCQRRAIRAHSIQNARFLDLLATDGHLIQLARHVEPSGPEVDFALVGRNRASTFTGLCSAHDQEIFAEIDSMPVDIEDPWHLFLLAYRAVLRETHATMVAGVKIQRAYLARVEAGLDPKGVPSPAGVFAVDRMYLAWRMYVTMVGFESAFQSNDPSLLGHDVLRFGVSAPSIAASTVFSLDGIDKDGETICVFHTILPIESTQTVAIYSYQRAEAELARLRLSRILNARGHHQMYEASRALLNSCENFVVRPAFFEEWSVEKRDSIRSYFLQTLFYDVLDVEDQNLMLFSTDT